MTNNEETKITNFEGSDLLPSSPSETRLSTHGDVVGYDNVEPEDLVLPTLKCLQGMSPEVMEQDLPGAKPGKFFLSSTKQSVPSPIRVLVVHYHRSRALFPNPKSPRGAGLEKCFSVDAIKGTKYGYCSDCEHAEWEDREPPPCSLSHNFIALTKDGPAVIRFNRTSLKAGKEFISSCRLATPRRNLWHHPTTIQAVAATRPEGGTYYKLAISWDREVVVSEEMQAEARKMFEQVHSAFSAGRLRDADEQGDEEPEPKQKRIHEDEIPF